MSSYHATSDKHHTGRKATQQQGQFQEDYACRPVQAYHRELPDIDLAYRSSLNGLPSRKPAFPDPRNYYGRKKYVKVPYGPGSPCVPNGLSGRYEWTGPVLRGYGVPEHVQIPNLVG